MWKKMVWFGSLSLAAALILLPVSAKATTMVYTNEASFKAVLDPGYYLQQFIGTVDTGKVNTIDSMPHSIAYVDPNGSGYKYTVSTDSTSTNLYWDPQGLSMAQSGSAMVITFTGTTPVTAIGGLFWPTDNNYNNLTGGITFTLSDGTKTTINAASASTFTGFATADGAAFTSLTIQTSVSTSGVYPTLNHLYVGADPVGVPVPEPSSLILLGSGLVGLGFYASNRRWRKK